MRMINREEGAGARLLLDYQLMRHGIPTRVIRGYQSVVFSHLLVARTIVEGKADVGVGPEVLSHLYNLSFIPLQEERYDLVVPNIYLQNHPGIQVFLDTLVTKNFRKEIEALGGYDTKEIGKVIQ